jgi:tRNA threonylcarbamoyladenosine modification (KEOPS) complex  Pcc1 subunit
VTTVPAEWTGRVRLRLPDVELAEWVERALGPEASREVPRSTATISRPDRGEVQIEIATKDAGAMRAALNTYLGWIHLALAAARSARRPEVGKAPGPS